MHWVNLLVLITYQLAGEGEREAGWHNHNIWSPLTKTIQNTVLLLHMSIFISNFELHVLVARFLSTLQENNNIRKKLCFLAFVKLTNSLLCFVNFRRQSYTAIYFSQFFLYHVLDIFQLIDFPKTIFLSVSLFNW